MTGKNHVFCQGVTLDPKNTPITVLRGITIVDSYKAVTRDGTKLSWQIPIDLNDPAQRAEIAERGEDAEHMHLRQG